MAEQKYVFDHEEEKDEGGFLTFLWNSRTKEFCGRDGLSWAKVSLFYGVFYTLLGGFFVGMLAVFASMLPLDKPTYYGTSSVMNVRGVNPGLGFRPQVDVEDWVIKYNPMVNVHKEHGLQRYTDNLKHFLEAKYSYPTDAGSSNLLECKENTSYITDFKAKKACLFDYQREYANTPCTEKEEFGYKTSSPCVLIKLNKIVSWEPVTDDGNIVIKCAGEFAYDRDNVKSLTYYSPGGLVSKENGIISAKYFPFMGQKLFKMPFIWVQFNVTENAYLNIECKAYAKNIDNDDRLNRRGQTKFALFITNKK